MQEFPAEPKDVSKKFPHDGAYDTWAKKDEIRTRIKRLARSYGKIEGLIICPILTGGMTFCSLYGRMSAEIHNPPIKVIPIVASSYGNGQSPSAVTLYHDWIRPEDLKDQYVLILDDLLETGATAFAAVETLHQFGCKEIDTAFIVEKESPGRTFRPTVALFSLPAIHPVDREKLFFVGCGMDFGGNHRFIEDIIDINSRPDLTK